VLARQSASAGRRGNGNPAPYSIRGKAGTHSKHWLLVFTGNPGYPLEFIPYLIRGGYDGPGSRKGEQR
jgi:hypothetical protein